MAKHTIKEGKSTFGPVLSTSFDDDKVPFMITIAKRSVGISGRFNVKTREEYNMLILALTKARDMAGIEK